MVELRQFYPIPMTTLRCGGLHTTPSPGFGQETDIGLIGASPKSSLMLLLDSLSSSGTRANRDNLMLYHWQLQSTAELLAEPNMP